MKNNKNLRHIRKESNTSLLELSAYSKTPIALLKDIEDEKIELSESELKIYLDYINHKQEGFLPLVDKKVIYENYETIGMVSLFDSSFSNVFQDARENVVGKVASASYGKDQPKSYSNLYNKLYEEKNTCLEFIRISNKFDIESSLRNNVDAKFHTRNDIIKHKENVACFKLKIPLMVVAHLVRHRTFSFNQVSRRYTEVKKDDIFIPIEYSNSNLRSSIYNHLNQSIELYNDLQIFGPMKKEIARGVLPAYLLFADLWMIGDKKAFQNLFSVRLSNDEKVQNLTKEVVSAMKILLDRYQPQILEK